MVIKNACNMSNAALDSGADEEEIVFTTEDLFEQIIAMHKAGHIHKRRGFSLAEATKELICTHLLEETVELQAECLFGRHKTQINEAADQLTVFLHLLWLIGVPLHTVVERAQQQLRDNFTLNPADVLTDTPGFTRQSRSGSK